MSNVPSELKYSKEHEWVATTSVATIVRIGITDFAQGALGDIVYIQLPKVGSTVAVDSVCGEVESTKSVSEIYAPVSGKIVAGAKRRQDRHLCTRLQYTALAKRAHNQHT